MAAESTSSTSRWSLWLRTDLPMLLVVLVWGLNFTMVKVSLRELNPLAFNALRFAMATTVFLVLLRASGESLSLTREDRLPIILLGICGNTLYQIAFIHGIAITSAANTSLLMATAPIFVAIYNWILRLERPNWRGWLAILLAFGGVVVLIVGGGGDLRLGVSATGDLMVLGSAMMWAIYTAGSQPLLRRYSAVKMMALTMAAGTPPLILVSLPQLLSQDWRSVSLLAWGGLLYSAVFSIVIAYVVWYSNVKRVGSSRTIMYNNLLPVAGVLIAWVTIGDRLAPLQIVGALVVIFSLMLARWARRGAVRV